MPFKYMENDDKCLLIGQEMAIWEKPASGDKFGPYKHPEDHLEAVYFHSKFDYYAEDATATVAVTHPARPASSGTLLYTDAFHLADVTVYADEYTTSRVLLTHNLGYVPKFLVADEDYNELPAEIPVQYYQARDGGTRSVRHYATTTQIIQVETAVPGLDAMSSLSKTYRVVAFRKPEADPEKPLYQATLSNIIAGQGKVDASEKHLRLAIDGETSFKLPTTCPFDLDNGQVRFVRGGGFWIQSIGLGPNGVGVDEYGGSFTGGNYLSVVA